MRGRRTESRTTSSMLRNRTIGSDGSASRTAFVIDACSVAAGSGLRSMKFMLPLSPNRLPSRAAGIPGKIRGRWSSSTYSSVPVGLSTPACLTSFATPITVTHGVLSPKRGLRRRPTGSRFFQKLRTNASFTTARSVPTRSVAWNARPCTIGILMASK